MSSILFGCCKEAMFADVGSLLANAADLYVIGIDFVEDLPSSEPIKRHRSVSALFIFNRVTASAGQYAEIT